MGSRLQAPKTTTGATMNRGNSRQDWGTPPEFLRAVRGRFGPLDVDLACTRENRIAGASLAFTPEEDALVQDWNQLYGNLWLNPEFADIRPWAAKCEGARHRLAWTLMLVPASIGTVWYAQHVYRKAYTLSVGRMKFVGANDPYPKDLMLACFGFGIGTGAIEPWFD